MPGKFSSFERVIGTPDEREKAEILDAFKEVFDEKKLREIQEHEIAKTPEDVAVINLANEATNEVRRKYGFPDFNIPPENVFIIEEAYWDWGEGGENARFSPKGQLIITPYSGPNFNSARLMFHEMLHFKSFGSLKVLRGSRMVEDRLGLEARTRKGKMYFRNLSDAVIETLSKEFIANLFRNKDQRFAGEIANLEQRGIDPEHIENGMIFGYGQQREALNALVDKIFERNAGTFNNQEEVFGIFVKSMFSNNLLAVGKKLIDKTFSDGTFRKIGRLDSNPEKLLKFVSSL